MVRAIAMLELQCIQFAGWANPVQALNVARLHLAVLKLGGRVFCVN